MDITPTSTATATTTAGAVKTPEAEAETPPSRIQQPPPIIKPLSFTNGVLKRLHPLNHHHHHHSPPAVVVTYKECLKNHAAAMGGHAVDGCGEFMPSPTATPSDPTSLKCAACGCHRNFHRRDPEEPVLPPPTPSAAQHVIEYQPHHRHHPPPPPPPPQPRGGNSTPNSPSPPPISSSYYPSAPHMLLALSSGLSGHPPESNPANNTAVISPTSSGRKRFRTRFTTEQKSKMYEFAEKIGWKFQKRDEQAISDFCGQVGVDRVVFKVWMHNNKNTLGKKEVDNTTTNGNNGNNSLNTATTDHHNGGDESLNHHQHNHNHQQHHSDSGSGHHVVVTNGSSSSS